MSAAFKRLTGCRAYVEYGMVPHGDRYQYQGSIEWMMYDFIKKTHTGGIFMTIIKS